MKKSLLALVILVLAAPAASAHTDAPAQLVFTDYGLDAPADWYTRFISAYFPDYLIGDSPLDPSSNATSVVVNQDEPYGFAEASNATSGIKGKPVAKVKNLSFEWSSPAIDILRAPRIHVLFTNGGYAMLSQAWCSRFIGTVKSGYNGEMADWFRSDFTGPIVNRHDCGLWMRSYTGVWDFYSATSTRSAWKTLALAKPGLVVKNAFWVFDTLGGDGYVEGAPNSGVSEGEIYTVQMDRLAIQNHMWTRWGPAGVTHCPLESSC